MDLGLRDRVYLVTGGSRGLGYAAAEALVAEGARVVVSARDGRAAARAAAALGPGRAVGLAADNADPATPGRLISAAREEFGRLDGALISVGGPPGGTALHTPDEAWQAAFGSVFLGAVRLSRALAGRPHRRRVDRVRAVLVGPRPDPLAWSFPTGCARAWPGSPRPWPTSWGRAGSG